MSDTGRKSIASVMGLATVGTIFSPHIALAESTNSCAVVAPTEVQINAVISSNPTVQAADAALAAALTNFRAKKLAESQALSSYQKALKTVKKSDDAKPLKAYNAAKQARVNANLAVTAAQARAAAVRQSVRDQINSQYTSLCSTLKSLAVSIQTASDQVNLHWNVIPGATSYIVSRDSEQIATITDNTYLDSTAKNGSTYEYTVTAIALIGASQNIQLTQDHIMASPVLPAPTNVQATQVNEQVNLSWSASTHATSYNIFRNGLLIDNVTETTYIDTDSSGGNYQIQAVENSVNSVKSAVVTLVIVINLDQPSNLVATAGNQIVNLSWDEVDRATTYRITRNGNTLATTEDPQFSDSTVTNGKTYFYRVIAVHGSFESFPSNSVSTTPQVPAPGAPIGFAATAGDTQVSLTWSAVSGATSYKVYRGSTLVATQSGTTFTDTGLVDGTTYSYTVKASNAGGDSAASSSASATPQVSAPNAPSNVQATAGNTQVSLSWSAVSGATSYKVYRGSSLIATQSGTTYADTGLSNGTAYSYTVKATNAGGDSVASSSISATPKIPAPSAPTGLQATAGNASVSLSWSASATATSYKVLRGGVQIGTSNTTTYTDSTAVNGTSYTYTVKATNVGGDSVASSSTSATPVAPIAPQSAPANVQATAGNASVSLSWSASATATSYKVLRGGVQIGTSNTTTYNDSTAVNGTSYTYTVKASNAGGDSVASSSTSATPQIPAPSAPASLSATASNNKVTLSWASAATATSYKVYRDGTLLASPSATSYVDSTAVNGTAYSYTVSAVNEGGESGQSSSASATPQVTAPGVPTGFIATPGSTQVSLSWSATSGASSYKIYRAGVFIATQSATTYTDTGLSNGTAYSYTVKASNAGGDSAASSSVSATPQVPAPSSAPANVQATAGNASVSLSWAAVSGATSYKVLRGGVQIGTSNTTTYTDSTAVNGTAYSYTVKASNAGGDSAASSAASATPVAPIVKLLAPTGLTANSASNGNSGAFRLSWNAVSGATSYTIYKNGVQLGTSASTTYTPVSTAAGSTNSYTVMATNATPAANSDQSAAITAVVYQGTPAPDQYSRNDGNIATDVIIVGKTITGCWAIYALANSESTQITDRAVPTLCQRVVSIQPTSSNATSAISNVSGATYSSIAYKTSLANALLQAGL